MTKQDQDIFFAIIRASIWVDDDGNLQRERLSEVVQLVPKEYDWKPLIKAFEDHAMLGVVAHVIMSLPYDVRPQSQEDQNHIISHVAQIIRQRYRMRKVIVEVFTKLQEAGCHPVLLKGEGLATLYPKNCHRSVGDVDIYIHPDEIPKAVECFSILTGKSTEELSHFDDMHQGIDYNGNEIELHYRLCDRYSMRCNTKVIKLAEKCVDRRRTGYVEINGKKIPVLPISLNLLYNFHHLCRHFLQQGAGLRHFIDIAFLISTSAEQEYKEFQEMLKKIQLSKPYSYVSAILSEYIGSDIQVMEVSVKKTEQLLQLTLAQGNFGRNDISFNPISFAIKYIRTYFKDEALYWIYRKAYLESGSSIARKKM